MDIGYDNIDVTQNQDNAYDISLKNVLVAFQKDGFDFDLDFSSRYIL